MSLHPETDDLFVMQGLAEAASRSPVPVLLVTMLHTAFAEYLGASADDSRRAEWQKVQGRFTDVAFQEPPEQLLRLVGSAIVRDRVPEELEDDYARLVERAVSSPALEEARHRLPLGELLAHCTPLDPVVALLPLAAVPQQARPERALPVRLPHRARALRFLRLPVERESGRRQPSTLPRRPAL